VKFVNVALVLQTGRNEEPGSNWDSKKLVLCEGREVEGNTQNSSFEILIDFSFT
jgi:hypothetical protein